MISLPVTQLGRLAAFIRLRLFPAMRLAVLLAVFGLVFLSIGTLLTVVNKNKNTEAANKKNEAANLNVEASSDGFVTPQRYQTFTGVVSCAISPISIDHINHANKQSNHFGFSPYKVLVFPLPKAVYALDVGSTSTGSTSSGTSSGTSGGTSGRSQVADVFLMSHVNISYDVVLPTLASTTTAQRIEVVKHSIDQFCVQMQRTYSGSSDSDSKEEIPGNRSFNRSSQRIVKRISHIRLVLSHDVQVLTGSTTTHHQTLFPLVPQSEAKEASVNESVAESEQYMISIPAGESLEPSITIIAQSSFGVSPAFASLAQLLASQLSTATAGLPIPLVIHDWPTHSWRGLMVDVARHFIPIDLLKRTIDGMAASKLNKLHLHLTDDQAFPVLLSDVTFVVDQNHHAIKLSRLAQHASHDRQHKVYTQQDLVDLVNYASLRSIEIIPEIDMPGRCHSWGKAFPAIIARCNSNHDEGLLNPAHNMTLIVVVEVLKQIAAIFPSKYLHIGAREVDINCLESDPVMSNYVTRLGTSVLQVVADFEESIIGAVKSLNKVPMLWDDFSQQRKGVLRPNNTIGAIMQPWKCEELGGMFTSVRAAMDAHVRGHPVVMSGCWYLSSEQEWGQFLTTDLISLAASTTDVSSLDSKRQNESHSNIDDYTSNNEIMIEELRSEYSISQRHKDFFAGGEGLMWTESTDHCNFECRLWPRAGALSARLWGYERGHPLTINISGITHLIIHSPSLQLRSNARRLEAPSIKIYPAIDLSSFRQLTLSHMSAIKMPQSNANSKWRRRIMHNQPLNLGALATKHLYATYIRYRYYLEFCLLINPAPFYIHIQDSNKKGLVPKMIVEESGLLKLVSKIDFGMGAYSDGTKSDNWFALTARCMGIPKDLQRPLRTDRISIAQLNVASGSHGVRGDQMLKWLQSKAAGGALMVGFCELNDWQDVEEKIDVSRNYPVIAIKAANAGFSYYHVMVHQQPFHLGLVSSMPFKIIGEYGSPWFQRGLLHVYYPKLDLHVMIVHLHAHESSIRVKEAQKIVEIAKPIIGDGKTGKLVIMGDMNTLSEWDRRQLDSWNVTQLLRRSDRHVFNRLRKKFFDHQQREISYEPMNVLLRAGMRDSCIEFCRQSLVDKLETEPINIKSVEKIELKQILKTIQSVYELGFPVGNASTADGYSWSTRSTDLLSQCMRKSCPYTEPTLFNPEWEEREPHPEIRLDFILVSDALIRDTRAADQADDCTCLTANVDLSNITDIISDHYPVQATWLYKPPIKSEISRQKSIVSATKMSSCTCNEHLPTANSTFFNLY